MISKNALITEADRFILDMQSNQQRYIDFLSTMAKYHKYGLTQQINLFFHAPAGASGAVATKAIWEKLGRKVADNAKPIPIMAGSEYQEHVEAVFDVSSTEGYQGEKLTWEYDEEKYKAYMDEHFPGPASLSMPERILNFTKSYTEALPWVQDKELTALSTAYVIMERLGYKAEDELGLELMLHSWDEVNVEATLAAVNEASKMVLSQIGDYIRKEERQHDTGRTDGNGAGISGNAHPLGQGGRGEERTDEGAGRVRPADGQGQGNEEADESDTRTVVGDLGEVHGGRETSPVDRNSPERESGAEAGNGGQGVQPEVRADESGNEEEERPEPHIPAEGLHGVHKGNTGDGGRDNVSSDPGADGTGVTEENPTKFTVTSATLKPVRTPEGGIKWVPEDVTEKEVSVDGSGKVTEESEPEAVAGTEQDSKDSPSSEEEVVRGYPRPSQAEFEMARKIDAGRVPQDKYLEYAIAALHVEFYRWHQIREFGGGMYETDGMAMNLVRNHILYAARRIEEHGLKLPESENWSLPPEAPENYMKLGTKNYDHRLKFFSKSTIENFIHELPPEIEAYKTELVEVVESSHAEEPAAEKSEEAAPAVEMEPKDEKSITTEDFSHLDFSADMSTVSGKRKVFERNMAAIRTVKRLEDEEREATPEEKKVLESYSGFGGLPEAFDQYNTAWTKEYHELRNTLTDAEYTAARASTLNAHFTPPELIQGIYEGLSKQGFDGGNILEPSCGSGRFFANMPEAMAQSSNIHGVELDPLTARITSQVYKDVTISNQPFERTTYADNSFDLAISNVPFGDYRITSDLRYKKQRPYIHDYFISKMVDEVRPGGYVVAMTSSGTMDKKSSKARADIAAKAELVGAIRLPNTAFNASGTSVTSDILILKKRETPLTITKDKKGLIQGADDNYDSWVETKGIKALDYKPLNRYFETHPENVLGKLALTSGPHGSVVTCEPGEGIDLQARIAEIIGGFENGYEKSKEPMEPPVQENVPASSSFGFTYENGRVVFHDVYGVSHDFQNFIHRQLVADAIIRQRDDKKSQGEVNGEEDLTAGRRKRINAVMAKAPELEKKVLSLIHIRDAVRDVFDAQTNACSNDELEALQETLNRLYDQHVKNYGHIYLDNALLDVFRNDPTCPLMEVLERVDEETGVFLGKADIFTERTVMPIFTPNKADSPMDALAFSMQEKGKVDVGYMASLMPETDVTVILKELTDKKLVFHDFEDDTYKLADEYLSGNVRAKLRKLEDERKKLVWDRELAVATAMMPEWQPTFTPVSEFEKKMLEIIQDSQQFVRTGNGKVRKGDTNLSPIYGFYNLPKDYVDYYHEHLKDREAMAHLAGAMRELNGKIPDELRNDPLFSLEAFRYGVRTFDSYDTGGTVIRDMLTVMEPKVDMNRYFQPAFVPYYKFLKEKFSEVNYSELDLKGRADFRDAVKKEWPAYKAAYDKQVENLLASRQNAEIMALQDRLKDLDANIEALEEVKPADIPAEDIRVTLGATWLPVECIKDFIKEELDLSYSEARKLKVEYSPVTGKWHIDKKNSFQNAKIDQTYGTSDVNALNLCELALNLSKPRVYKNGDDNNRVINPEATSAAQMKQEDLKRAFSEWLMKDEKRAKAVVALYNEKFNAIVPREYNGEYLRFPGMNPSIQLKDHQKAAIAHTLYGGNTLFAHAVGAGKTYEMIASAMEAKRLGLSKKALMVVPKHLTEQTGAAFMKLYPKAKILVAQPSDFEKKNRKAFVAKVATQNWDAVIMGYTQFERISITPERRIALQEQRIGELEEAIDELRNEEDSRHTIKKLESMLKRACNELEKAQAEVENHKDDMPIYFEELGIDRLYVDEAHNFKNCSILSKMSSVAGINSSKPAVRAMDLMDKCQYINEKTNYKGVVFATGTPVSNSMTDLYVMQKYLQPNVLKEAGINGFDDWAATFGETVTGFELKPEGKGFIEKTRFSRFYNLPELMTIVKVTADIKTADMLDLDVPNCEMIVDQIEPTENQATLVNELAARADVIRDGGVDPSIDNMLRVTTEGRMLALDERIIDPTLPDNPNSKVNKCIQNVLKIYRETADKHSTQIIFCDKSVPNKKEPNKFNVYDDIRNKLVAAGVSQEEIAFVQEAKDDDAKEQLFAKTRAGKIRILLGGTENLGVGTNVQDKLIATHDLDVPWKPADLEQRMGRIVRRGNENKDVKVFRYVTKGTFDAYTWQLIENKQRFISQIMSSKIPAREADDCDEVVLSAAEIKALAAGDPLIKEKMDVDNAYNRLKIDKATFLKNRDTTVSQVKVDLPNRIAQSENHLEKQLKNKELWEENTHKTTGLDGEAHESFSIVINGKKYLDEKEAIKALDVALDPNALTKFSGEYKGFKLSTAIDWMTKQPYLQAMNTTDFRFDIYGGSKRMLNAIKGIGAKIDKQIAEEKSNLDTLKHNLEVAKKTLEAPYPREAEFQRLKARSEEIDMILAAKDKGLTEEKDIKGDVRRSRILKLVDKDGHMDFTKMEGKTAIERTYLFKAAEALTKNKNAYAPENAMSTDKGIASAMIAKGYDLENIYKTIEELSPSMIKAVDVKRLVGEKKEDVQIAMAR